ncbi:DEAD/DEAH box helicase [Planctomycetota bacterium]|nr:DEAD/DEAH box helicase [Planctomycetota bacterium]
MTAARPDVSAELGRLKGFQQRAARNAFERLFLAPDRTRRFLVADEVGLGKTLIARGVTALAIDHLWGHVDRIDVVYVCSNASIARQNVARLGFGAMRQVERLTLLPISVQELEGSKLNFVAITPGTSLERGRSLGTSTERQLLYHLLQELWPVRGSGPKNLLQGTVRSRERWRLRLRDFYDRHSISEGLQGLVHAQLEHVDAEERRAGGAGLRARWESACSAFGYYRSDWSVAQKRLRRDLVSELLRHLARACVDALEPDLVILDEFQRFKQLLDPDAEDEAGQLAQRLFEWSDDKEEAHVLLLSATPYKMYTLAHEADEEDHYGDFLRTIRFLQRDPGRTARLEGLLEEYRRGLFRLAEGEETAAVAACQRIEVELRRVMSRTERTGVTGGRDGMVRTVAQVATEVATRDLVDFVRIDRLARELGVTYALEVWKSAPYMLSFSEGYELDRRMLERCGEADPHVADLVADAERAFLDPRTVEGYRAVEPANARLRALVAQMVDSGLWQCLWLPPSAPSYGPSAAYQSAAGATKRLVFSSWTVVPRALSALLSYEVERRAAQSEDPGAVNTAEARDRRRPLLRFQRSDGRLTGMPVLGLVCPSAVLARVGDPRRHRRLAGGRLERSELLDRVRAELRVDLDQVTAGAPQDGPVDEAWYWAAPILLDKRASGGASAFWDLNDLEVRWSEVESESGDGVQEDGWGSHVDEARQVARGSLQLGRPPEDLAELMALVAVGGPATAALRALARVLPDGQLEDIELQLAAAQIGWGFRTLFNRPESTAIVRGRERRVPFWRLVVEHCVDGCLGDVLDEHLHLLRESEGLFGADKGEAAPILAEAVRAGTGIRTTRMGYRAMRRSGGRVEFEKHSLRGHFALAFSTAKAEGEERGMRTDQVRAAFNSPFWPFVLTTTSVGQEGLDFHAWCHAVVHWNLPSNPIDLEQREGRVHRFKGHAVRKNVAALQGAAELESPIEGDPWAGMFERARASVVEDGDGLVPYWVFEAANGAHIERHVPALPHSKDQLRFRALQQSLALYRMVFGQPRQDDLMAFLIERVPEELRERVAGELQVDLSPR